MTLGCGEVIWNENMKQTLSSRERLNSKRNCFAGRTCATKSGRPYKTRAMVMVLKMIKNMGCGNCRVNNAVISLQTANHEICKKLGGGEMRYTLLCMPEHLC